MPEQKREKNQTERYRAYFSVLSAANCSKLRKENFSSFRTRLGA